jgi:hypothetical protein
VSVDRGPVVSSTSRYSHSYGSPLLCSYGDMTAVPLTAGSTGIRLGRLGDPPRKRWSARPNPTKVGNPGTGKSHLAIALSAAACSKGYRVRFFRVTELVTQLIEARDERGLMGLKARLGKLDLLVLDEFGYVPASKIGAELLFDVISSAYERTSLIVTTNLPFEQWTEVLGSERLTGATLDRLTHRCQIIETKGESYRLRDAKARITKPAASGNQDGSSPTPEPALEGGEGTR